MYAKLASAIGVALLLAAHPARAEDSQGASNTGMDAGKASADAIAKELANPAGSLASLKNNFEFRDYEGDLPGADGQDGWSYSFQPVLPFPVGEAKRIIFRPLIPVKLDEPVFKPRERDFDTEGIDLGDTTFDLVYAGTEITDPETKRGFLWGVGAAGTLPTGTDEFGGDQWRLGPEFFGGILRDWGVVGGLLSHQWEVAGANHDNYSVTALQYFYAYGLGNGWQIAASPVVSCNWAANGGDAWTVPLGVGLAKTRLLGNLPVKFQFEVAKYLVQPDTFGPDWLVKLTITPVIKNPFIQ
jgi:hypothetical protein